MSEEKTQQDEIQNTKLKKQFHAIKEAISTDLYRQVWFCSCRVFCFKNVFVRILLGSSLDPQAIKAVNPETFYSES